MAVPIILFLVRFSSTSKSCNIEYRYEYEYCTRIVGLSLLVRYRTVLVATYDEYLLVLITLGKSETYNIRNTR